MAVQPTQINKLFTVALTGGIGSGKSTVSRMFQSLGITCIDVDQIARDLVAPKTPALAQIHAHFGPSILQPSGELNREALRQKIFSRPEQKNWLEALLHPLIKKARQEHIKSATSPYVLVEIPLLFETNAANEFDRTLLADAPENIQIERASLRDNSAPEHIQNIIDKQISRDYKRKHCDDIIDTNTSLRDVEKQVESLHAFYLAQAKDLK